MGEEYKKPLRKLRVRGSKQYLTVEYGAKPKKGDKYQYLFDLNDEDFINGAIDDYEWYQNRRDINNDASKDHEYDQSTMIMPEITVNAGWSPKKVFHTTDAYADRSLQRSFDIIANNPDLYGKFLSKRFKSRSPSSFRKLWPEIIHSMPPGHEDADAITSPIGSVYTRDILNGTYGSKSTRAHELNHALWRRPLLRRKHEKVKSMLYDAYSPHEGDFDKFGSSSEISELIASNSDLRNYIYEHSLDPNDYNFFEWGENETSEYVPYVNMPTLSGYFPGIRTSIENYANERYRELINERGEDHADEIRQEITDEINKRIRLALSTVAYNQVSNQDQPLYAKAGGVLIPKFGEGSGAVAWILHWIAKVSPQTARLLGYTKELSATKKEIPVLEKTLQGQLKNSQGLQKGVQRANNISKSQQFKELVSGLGLEDRVSQELISRYNGLDPKTQSTERNMLLRLMKNNQIHSIADFDLAVDKVHSNKMGGNPNILGIKTISDLNTPYAESWEKKRREKQEYDRAFGTFTKEQEYPDIGYSLYNIPETRQGQQDLLTVMRGQYNKKIQPWCVIETDKKTGELTPAAIERWDKEYAGPKFALMDKKGKIRYLQSGKSGWFDLKDILTGSARGTQPIIKTGNRSVYEMFQMPLIGLHINPVTGKYTNISQHLPKIQDMVSMDLRNGTKVDKLSDIYGTTYWINRPWLRNSTTRLIFPSQEALKDEYTSQFMSKSRRDYGFGPVPGTEGKWYKTASGKWRFAEGIHDNHFLYFDESGNLLKHHGTLFDPKRNMMLQQNDRRVGLYRGKDQESLLRYDLDGPGFGDDAKIFGVTPLYEQFYSDGQLHPWDYSDQGEDVTDLPSALKKFGFQLPELKEGGAVVQEKN